MFNSQMEIRKRSIKALQLKKLHNQLAWIKKKRLLVNLKIKWSILTRPLEEDGSIEIVTPGSDEARFYVILLPI